MTYYAAQPMPMAGMGGLTDVLKAPITFWNQSSTIHKVLAAGAGAGLAYFLHQKGMADAAVAAAGVAGAYATSMALHYPAVAQQSAMVPASAPAGALPAAPPPVANQTQQPMGVAAPAPAPGSKWSLLG